MNGTIACESLLAAFRGELPAFPVNREVIEQPGFRQKLDSLAARWREFGA